MYAYIITLVLPCLSISLHQELFTSPILMSQFSHDAGTDERSNFFHGKPSHPIECKRNRLQCNSLRFTLFIVVFIHRWWTSRPIDLSWNFSVQRTGNISVVGFLLDKSTHNREIPLSSSLRMRNFSGGNYMDLILISSWSLQDHIRRCYSCVIWYYSEQCDLMSSSYISLYYVATSSFDLDRLWCDWTHISAIMC